MITGSSGSPDTPISDELLAEARSTAAGGHWAALRDLLLRRADAVRVSPELGALAGEAALRCADPRGAMSVLSDAVAAFDRQGNRPALRRSLNLIGAACFELGDIPAAEQAWSRTLELATHDADDLVIARATNNLGAIANIRGARDAALAHYHLAVPAYQRLGNALGLAQSYHNMAITFRDARRLDEADEYEQRATEFAREAGDRTLLAMASVRRAELSLLRGDAELAAVEAYRAADECERIPAPVTLADALRLAGAAATRLGRRDEARGALDRAISLAQAHGSALVEAESLRARVELNVVAGDLAAARRDGRAAVDIFTKLGAATDRDELRVLLSQLEHATGDATD